MPIFSGAVSGLLYALPGALLSYAGMLLLLPLYQRERISAVGLSVFGAFLYNAAGVPIAAGALYPVFGLLLSPVIAAAAMALSSVSVIGNALRLRTTRI